MLSLWVYFPWLVFFYSFRFELFHSQPGSTKANPLVGQSVPNFFLTTLRVEKDVITSRGGDCVGQVSLFAIILGFLAGSLFFFVIVWLRIECFSLDVRYQPDQVVSSV